MPGQAEVVRLLAGSGLRTEVKVLVGGAPTNEEWARSIGADAHAHDAVSAVKAAESLMLEAR
jgi:methanogenic corrinoid protein MtbC1